ncbi:hypothetical protein RFI_36474 [Reticulomyxa filosa]|uniref:NACHT domain-containing protein n=1 Tax=Reticulomyxa filosa TaxID=46433 RepID=X6LHZ6_RETFI|nr:hypothetical protein RFI_36474 [Reticulomyxa filosa]|eukprot:ETO00966.1 hypothetical protein RFI_36474 [Reticulomyxa filosa]
MNGLLLLLDGFDEIANEIENNTNLKTWLQHCASNQNYFIIMISRSNGNVMLNVIGFQSQDIQNYINAYFKYNNQSNTLIKKLNNNQSLKLLSHTPLYLRLFCYLSRQDKLITNITMLSKGFSVALFNQKILAHGIDYGDSINVSKLTKEYEEFKENYNLAKVKEEPKNLSVFANNERMHVCGIRQTPRDERWDAKIWSNISDIFNMHNTIMMHKA